MKQFSPVNWGKKLPGWLEQPPTRVDGSSAMGGQEYGRGMVRALVVDALGAVVRMHIHARVRECMCLVLVSV